MSERDGDCISVAAILLITGVLVLVLAIVSTLIRKEVAPPAVLASGQYDPRMPDLTLIAVITA